MKSIKLALSLTLASSVIVACGGGGDARSPDRPGLSVDPSTLQIKFVNDNNALAGTGNNRISVRMLALRSDGINKNVGPAQVLTSKTLWSLKDSDLGSPVAATLAEDFREISGLSGKVQDILSSRRLSVDDSPINTTITGVYRHNGQDYPITAAYTIQPPVAMGEPFISGPTTIVLNPLDANDTATGKYSLLQALQNLASRENRTHTARFCENSEFLEITETQPRPTTDGDVDILFSNPFADGTTSQLSVEIYAVDADKTCDDTTAKRYGPITVNLVAGTVSDVAACVITNPADDTCSAAGDLNANYVGSCIGLDSDEVNVPAAQHLQMAARLTYTNPQDQQQPALNIFKCASPQRLAWSADPQQIFSAVPDAANGNGSTANRLDFDNIAAADRFSNVTATYTRNPEAGADATAISDTLKLNLKGAEVAEIRIDRVDGQSGPDKIFLNVFREGIEYEAKCRFSDFGVESSDFVTCPSSLTSWTVSPEGIVAPQPSSGSRTDLTPVETPNGSGEVTLTATYSGGLQPISASRNVLTEEDSIVELRLFMQPNGNDPDTLAIDQFACVGRDDLVGTLREGEFIRGGQQFKAYALFASSGETATPQAWLDAPNSADSQLRDISDQAEVRFSAVSGYWQDGCASGLSGTPLPPELVSQFPSDLPVGSAPAAGFDEDRKGYLKSRGLLRLSTVCVQAFIDPDLDGFTEGDTTSVDGSTVLVLPVADDDLLTYSNELCETLEPVLTLGGTFPGMEGSPGIVVPLLYGISLIADPVLAALATNEDGGALPVEEILTALITGEFSQLGAPQDSPVGLGDITSGLLNGVEAVPGLGIIVDVLDACLVAPTTDALGIILTGVLGTDPAAFGDLANISPDDCTNLFSGLGG
ncbi:hypothetical protein [Spongiibacter sp.]|uniref:hypothetical protein n=1 Tax=Spongiibacter sp. TaxID=2024860 RepID=UPI0035652237